MIVSDAVLLHEYYEFGVFPHIPDDGSSIVSASPPMCLRGTHIHD